MEIIDERMFWDQLLQFIDEGKVIPIVGRDLLTIEYQKKSELLYSLIARRLAGYLGISGENLTEGDELNTIACRFIETGNRIEDIYSAIKTVMKDIEDLAVPEPLIKLAQIRSFKLFVSTTFDSLLEQAINKERFSGLSRTKVFSYTPNTVEDIDNPIDKMDRPAVFHLFGKLSAIPAYAVTQEDTLEYLHSLQSESRQPQRLFDELNRDNLLFLGCNYNDWLARFFIRTPKRLRLLEGHGGTDYVADAKMSNDQNLLLFLRYFSTRTKIFNDGGALDFIDKLHSRWIASHPLNESGEFRENVSESPSNNCKPGTVFLSYASEDKSAALRLRDSLEGAGVEVFFDKDSLYAGDDYEVKIIRSINECSLFVVIISKYTLTEERRFFRLEWNQALEEARKASPAERFVLPVVIDDTQPDNPAIPSQFNKLHWEKAPDGEVSPDFVLLVKQLYREYQKIRM